jgi:hypothetical protein
MTIQNKKVKKEIQRTKEAKHINTVHTIISFFLGSSIIKEDVILEHL